MNDTANNTVGEAQTRTASQALPNLQTIAKGDEQFQTIAGFSSDLTLAGAKKTMQEVGAKSADLWQVPVDALKELPGFNMRLDSKESTDHIHSLFTSMMANGYYKDKPLTGFVPVDPADAEKKVIYYTDGHHRMAAVRMAIANGKKIEVVPIILKDKASIADLTVASYDSNNRQKPYTTLETALVCLRLRQGNPPSEKPLETFQIAERLNLTKPYVETLLTLARAPKEIRDMVQVGKVSASVAIDTLRKKGENAKVVLQNAVKVAEQKAAAQPAKVKETAQAGGVKPSEKVAEKTETVVTKTTSMGTSSPTQGTTVATTPASKVAAETVKPVRVTKGMVDPGNKFEEELKRMAKRLYEEVVRLEEAKKIEVSPELEKILFIIDAAKPPKAEEGAK